MHYHGAECMKQLINLKPKTTKHKGMCEARLTGHAHNELRCPISDLNPLHIQSYKRIVENVRMYEIRPHVVLYRVWTKQGKHI